jgi:hypothetical protein
MGGDDSQKKVSSELVGHIPRISCQSRIAASRRLQRTKIFVYSVMTYEMSWAKFGYLFQC